MMVSDMDDRACKRLTRTAVFGMEMNVEVNVLDIKSSSCTDTCYIPFKFLCVKIFS